MKTNAQYLSEYESVLSAIGQEQKQLQPLRTQKLELTGKLQQSQARDQTNTEKLATLNHQLSTVSSQMRSAEAKLSTLYQQASNYTKELNKLVTSDTELKQKIVNTETKYQDITKQIQKYQKASIDIMVLLNGFSAKKGINLNQSEVLAKLLPPEELVRTDILKNAMSMNHKEEFDRVLDKITEINFQDVDGKTLIMHAAGNGFYYGVDKLLARGADVNILDKDGCNALMYACGTSHIKYVKIIAEKTNDVNIKSKLGDTALHHLLQGKKILYPNDLSIEVNYAGGGVTIVLEGDIFTTADNTFGITDRDRNVIGNITSGSRPGDGFNLYENKVLNIIKLLTDAGANINCLNNAGVSPLFLSMKALNSYASKKLLETYPISLEDHMNMTDQSGIHLMSYCLADHNLLKLMLAKGFNVNTTNINKSAPSLLQQALSNTLFDVSKTLLESGANAKYLDNNGHSCWHHLVYRQPSNHNNEVTKLVKLLLQYNNELNCQDIIIGATPFFTACIYGNVQTLIELKNLGADINIPNKAGFHPIYAAVHNGHIAIIAELLKWGVNIDCKSSSGYTPLQQYCGLPNNKVEVVKFLLDSGAQVNHFDKNGMTPFHVAAFKGNLEIVKLLFERGKLNVDLKPLGDNDCTALWFAAQEGKIETVKWLVEQGANLNSVRTTDGRSAIQAGICQNQSEVVKFLIEKGVSVNQPNKAGFTPIYHACEKSNTKVVKLLVDNKADINISGESGDQPIHMAAALSNINIMKLLLDHGASINAVSNIGNTPLHEVLWEQSTATNNQKLVAIKYLLGKSALTNVKDEKGKTILDLAGQSLPEAVYWLQHPETIPPLGELELELFY